MDQREPRQLESAGIARLQHVIDEDISAGRCDGVSLRVSVNGVDSVGLCVGYADRAAGRALRDDAVFVTMSTGKQFTNAVALSAIEQGALSFSTQAADILPSFSGSAWRGMTVAHLLCNTSGVIPDATQLPGAMLIDPSGLAAFAAARGPAFVPGSRVGYSMIAAHAVLSEIVRVAWGGSQDFARIVCAELFEPLGMRDSSLRFREDLMPRLCPVVARYDQPGLFDPRALEGFNQLVATPGGSVPAGGYLTTASDMWRFVRMLSGDGTRLLSPAMLALCSRNQTGSLPNDLFEPVLRQRGWQPWSACMGLGFYVRGESLTPGPLPDLASATTIGGWGEGATAFWCDPVQRVCFSLMSTGLMEDSRHIQRVQRLSDIVLASLST